MNSPWGPLAAAITKIQDSLQALPAVREAVVYSTTPLSVMFDTDSAASQVHRTLVSQPAVGARVLTLKVSHYIWILGVAGGAQPEPASHAEVNAGTDSSKFVTPLTLGASNWVRQPVIVPAANISTPSGAFTVSADGLITVTAHAADIRIMSFMEAGWEYEVEAFVKLTNSDAWSSLSMYFMQGVTYRTGSYYSLGHATRYDGAGGMYYQNNIYDGRVGVRGSNSSTTTDGESKLIISHAGGLTRNPLVRYSTVDYYTATMTEGLMYRASTQSFNGIGFNPDSGATSLRSGSKFRIYRKRQAAM